MTGALADSARVADRMQRGGQLSAAIVLLESALESAARERPELPAWLCGRLAALYRRAGRLDDEVQLLERCRESQPDDLRARIEARLYKARALASRRSRSESGALRSVARVRQRNAVTRRAAVHLPEAQDPAASNERIARLVDLFQAPSFDEFSTRLSTMPWKRFAKASRPSASLETVIQEMKEALERAQRTARADGDLDERYSAALVQLLDWYYGERDDCRA